MAKKVRLGVLVSGGGTTLQNFIDKIAEGALNAEIVAVITSRPGVYALERAERAGIPAEVVNRKDYDSVEAFSEAITTILDKYGVELAAMAGFLSLYRIPDSYLGRVLNIHPALLPGHGGKGYYGDKVHAVVLESGDGESGCTVHFADNVYDHGPIAVQRRVPVLPGDTVKTLRKRVFEQECIAYPEAINLFASGKLAAAAAKLRKT